MKNMTTAIKTALNTRDIPYYLSLSRRVRKSVLEMVYTTKSPHIGPCFSAVEILIALYWDALRASPSEPLSNDRDRFILSKGHACPALYAVLAERGFISPEVLARFAVNDGTLEQHPNMDTRSGIELSTGSLGHGLSVAVGMALAAKIDGKDYRTFVLSGDGELNEGTVWEAAMFAAHHQLDNLVTIVDYNKMQALGYTSEILDLDPLASKWTSFGWAAREIDGHNYDELLSAFDELPFVVGRPSVLIAHTIKGKGVSFMENDLLWHYRSPDNQEYQRALRELNHETIIF